MTQPRTTRPRNDARGQQRPQELKVAFALEAVGQGEYRRKLFTEDSEQHVTLHMTFGAAIEDALPSLDLYAYCDGETTLPAEGQAAIDAMRGHLQGGDPHTWATQYNCETRTWDVAAIDVLIFKPSAPGSLPLGAQPGDDDAAQ